MNESKLARALALVLVASPWGCAREGGGEVQLLVHLRTDVPAQAIDGVELEVLVDGEVRDRAQLRRSLDDRGELGSLGVVPAPGDREALITLRLSGHLGGEVAVRTERQVRGFGPRSVRDVFVCLASACREDRGSACGAEEVCGLRGCEPRAAPEHTLPPDDWSACRVERVGDEAGEDMDTLPGAGLELDAMAFGGPDESAATDVAVADTGQLAMTGAFRGTFSAGRTSLTSVQTDGYLLVLDRGGSVSWVAHFGGAGHQSVNAVELADSGDVYVVGSFTGELLIEPAGARLTAAGEAGFVARFTADGALERSKALDGLGLRSAEDLADAGDGRWVVVGSGVVSAEQRDSLRWQGRPGPAGPSDPGDAQVLMIDEAFEYVAGASIGGPGADRALAVAVAKGGAIYVSGEYEGAVEVLLASGRTLTLPRRGGTEAFVARIDAGGPGVVVGLATEADDVARALAVTRTEQGLELGVAGRFGAGELHVGDGTIAVEGRALGLLFDQQLRAPRVVASSRASAVAPSRVAWAGEALLLAGSFTDHLALPSGDLSLAGRDAFVLEVSLAGEVTRGLRLGANALVELGALAVTPRGGQSVLAGSFRGSIPRASGGITASGVHDVFLVSLPLPW